MKQFGTFQTCEELNKAADGLLKEKDIENIKKLAKENGIPMGMVQNYIDGKGTFCDVQTAAIGSLEVALKELKGQKNALGQLVVSYLSAQCEKEEKAEKIMQKAPKLKEFIERMFEEAKKKAGGNTVYWLSDDEIKAQARQYFIRGKEPWKKQK